MKQIPAILIGVSVLVCLPHCGQTQNSLVGDGFGGRLWYNPTNYSVGSYSAYSICYEAGCEGDNHLYGWGTNGNGQLGYEPLTYPGFNVPTVIPVVSDLKYYSTGYNMGAIKNDNTGWVWGDLMPSVTPSQVISDVKFLDGGMSYVAFVKFDGTVWCIGSSQSGEFGTGNVTELATEPVQMQGITNAVRVACGYNTTFVLLADGTIKAVGSNVYGLLGIGVEENIPTTTPITIPGLNNIIDIKAHTLGTSALDANGNVYTWGAQGDLLTIIYSPVQIISLNNIVGISGCADGGHFLALDAEKNCYGWGVLPETFGLPLGSDGLLPSLVATDVIDIMAGETFSYIVKSDGSLWCTGSSIGNYASIWLNLPNQGNAGFLELDPGLVPEACSVSSLNAFTSYSCESAGTITVVVNGIQGPFLYNIGNGDQESNVFNDLSPGEYTIVVTDGAGCTTSVSTNIYANNNDYPIASLDSTDQVCEGESVIVDAGNPGASFLWNTGETSQIIEVSAPGPYTVQITLNGCTITDEIVIEFMDPPIFSLGPDIMTCFAEETTLTADYFSGAEYYWNTGAESQSIIVDTPGEYSCTIDLGNCSFQDSIIVSHLDSSPLLTMPNIFTPNGDSTNELFGPRVEDITSFNLKIYNRWGTLIFETTDITIGWDGTSNGKDLPEGTYYYIISYNEMCTDTKIKTDGTCTLLR